MKENEKVISEMKEKEKNIKNEIERLKKSTDPTDKYKSTSFKDKLLKYQAEIKNKQSTIEEMKNLYGEKGNKLLEKWKGIIQKRKDLLKIVEGEKSKEDNQIKRSIVDDELKEKLREIQKLNKELLVAYFFEGELDKGELDKLTKKEKDEYDRKEKPTDNVSTIKSNIENLEDEYIDISAKISDTEKFQALIKLYYEKLERIKYLKDGKKREKEKVDSKLKEIARTLRDLKSSVTSITPQSGNTDNNPQIKIQKEEQLKEIERFEKINDEYKMYDDIKNSIEKNIEQIKGAIKNNNYSGFDKFYDDYKKEAYLTAHASGGGYSRIHNKPKHKSKRNKLIKKKGLKNRYKTKRILNRVKNTKHKTLRRLKKRYRKRKYTIKQRKN